MATKNYQWREYINTSSDTPYPTGSSGSTDWQSTTSETGSLAATYWYTDSNRTDWQNNYSHVFVEIQDSWTVSFDNNNVMTVVLTSNIVSVTRGDITGTPTTTTAGRDISIYREQGGARLYYVQNDQIGNAHTIATNIDLGTVTFTLNPGQDATRSSVYYHNLNPNNQSYDDLWMGVQFKNIQPADYRPGKVRDSNGDWQSCNRSGGKCNILTNNSGTTKELRTINGDGVTTGDPPSIYANSAWRNQRKIGQNA